MGFSTTLLKARSFAFSSLCYDDGMTCSDSAGSCERTRNEVLSLPVGCNAECYNEAP